MGYQKLFFKAVLAKWITVEPPVSDHSNAKTEWSLTGGGRLQESNHRAPFPRRGPGTSTLRKKIFCMQFLSYAICSSMLSQKLFVCSKYLA